MLDSGEGKISCWTRSGFCQRCLHKITESNEWVLELNERGQEALRLGMQQLLLVQADRYTVVQELQGKEMPNCKPFQPLCGLLAG